LQEQASNRLKLRRLRAEVVSVDGKGGVELRQVWIEKTNASEPLMTCRKRQGVIKTSLADEGWEECGGRLPTARTVTGIEAA